MYVGLLVQYSHQIVIYNRILGCLANSYLLSDRVKQGNVVSPWLFNIYIDICYVGLLFNLKHMELCSYIRLTCSVAFVYFDDLDDLNETDI